MTLTFHDPDHLARRGRRARADVDGVAADVTAMPAPEPASTKIPRPGSRLAAMVTLMQRPEGATVAVLTEATGWMAHSVRGAIAGALKKTYGLTITSTPAGGGRIYRIAAPQTGAEA